MTRTSWGFLTMKKISVTQILSPFTDFSRIDPATLAAAADRGTKVHAMAAAHLAGIYAPFSSDSRINLFYLSFREWCDKFIKQVFFTEHEFIDERLGLVGHPDMGVELIDGQRLIPDIKTPQAHGPTWRAQTAAYLYLANREYGDGFFMAGAALQLHPEGKMPKMTIYKTTAADWSAFLSALNAYRYFKG